MPEPTERITVACEKHCECSSEGYDAPNINHTFIELLMK